MLGYYVFTQSWGCDVEGNPERQTDIDSFHVDKKAAMNRAFYLNKDDDKDSKLSHDEPKYMSAIVFPYIFGTPIAENTAKPVQWREYPVDWKLVTECLSVDVQTIVSNYIGEFPEIIECKECHWYSTPAKVQCYGCSAMVCVNCTTKTKRIYEGDTIEHKTAPMVDEKTHMCEYCANTLKNKDKKAIQVADDCYLPKRLPQIRRLFTEQSRRGAGEGYDIPGPLDDRMFGTRYAPQPYYQLQLEKP